MITKDQLEKLRQPKQMKAEVHYTIGGATETAVHQNVERERQRQHQQGKDTMQKAVQDFRQQMALKSREGLARSQFQKAQEPTKQDQAKPQERRSNTTRNDRVNSFKQAVNDNHKTIER